MTVESVTAANKQREEIQRSIRWSMAQMMPEIRVYWLKAVTRRAIWLHKRGGYDHLARCQVEGIKDDSWWLSNWERRANPLVERE